MKGKFGKWLPASLFLVLLLMMPFLVATPVIAVTYNYTGNPYNYFVNPTGDPDFGTHLTASFTFDSSVVTGSYTGYQHFVATSNTLNNITSWSATSGSITLSSTAGDTEAGAMFYFTSGAIDAWYFAVGDYAVGYYLASYNNPGGGAQVFDEAINYWVNNGDYKASSNSDTPGTWTKVGSSNQVPEPATMLLLGLGLMGFAGVRRKFKK